jgi:hypothetical protein
MLSEKQLAANRENARKSTGPQSPETKKAVSQNALRHGLTGQVTLMPDEDREAHDQFCAAIVQSLAPAGALEIQLAQSIAEDNWRMNRGRAIETNLFALGTFYPAGPGTGQSIDTGHDQINTAINAAQVFAADPKKFQLLSLYMQRTSRTMEKSLDRLTALQTDRKALRQQDLEEAAALLQLNEIKRLPITESAAPGPNGFVFSTPEIRLFLDRKRRLNEAKSREAGQSRHQNHYQTTHTGSRNEKHLHARAA